MLIPINLIAIEKESHQDKLNQHLIFSANFANVGDNIFDNGNWFSSPDYTGYAIGCSAETFLGPIEIKYSWTPDTRSGKWFFNLGFWF